MKLKCEDVSINDLLTTFHFLVYVLIRKLKFVVHCFYPKKLNNLNNIKIKQEQVLSRLDSALPDLHG